MLPLERPSDLKMAMARVTNNEKANENTTNENTANENTNNENTAPGKG